jgi:hypothetical protein
LQGETDKSAINIALFGFCFKQHLSFYALPFSSLPVSSVADKAIIKQSICNAEFKGISVCFYCAWNSL